MNLIDMHCDTLTELYKSKESFYHNTKHISLEKARCFKKYIQVCAVWSDKNLSDNECFTRFTDIVLQKNVPENDKIVFLKTKDEFVIKSNTENYSFILSVEDGRLLSGDISRLDYLSSCGVKFLTPVWSGVNCLGGAYDTECGLSDFGRDVMKKCFELGIFPDISHASGKLTSEVLLLAEKAEIPPVATHSDSYSICPHPRNLSDDEFNRIKELGGIVGISLAPMHLSPDGNADIDDICRHIEYYFSLGGEKSVVLGCDFDGIDKTPAQISDVSGLSILYDRLSTVIGRENTDNIFYNNAYDFLYKYMI